jgi:predicted component of type VI protein secretion system
MAFLYHLSLEGAPLESWSVPEAGLVVGRGELAGATVDDNSLSRSHFLILMEAGSFFIVDLESHNGTRVDGGRVTGMKLRDGAVIHAGQSVFYFSLQRLPTHAPPILMTNPPSAISSAVSGSLEVRATMPSP